LVRPDGCSLLADVAELFFRSPVAFSRPRMSDDPTEIPHLLEMFRGDDHRSKVLRTGYRNYPHGLLLSRTNRLEDSRDGRVQAGN